MSPLSASDQVLKLARQHLLEFGECLPGMLDAPLAQSWKRSLCAGLLPVRSSTAPELLTQAELLQVIDHNHDLLAYAQPVMEFVCEQIQHSQSMLVLSDRNCTLIHALGDQHFLDKAQRVALSPGASWHEDNRGTNAIGLALTEQMPIKVHGAEHYLEQNGFLHCAAAPVFSPKGDILGILDISGDKRQDHAHSLGLVRTAARMIENRWIISTMAPHCLRLHLHASPFGLDTVAEGILILSPAGLIVGANLEAMRMLGLTREDFDCLTCGVVLSLSLDELLRRQGSSEGQAFRLPLNNSRWVHARLRGEGVYAAKNLQTVQLRAFDASHKAPSPAIKVQPETDDALARLDTGDARWCMAAQKVRKVLDKPIPLLIQGESGSGKELFAKAAHESSNRKDQPFVAINCAAIPETLIEAELFGYVPGAFTGARREGSKGKLREAHGGTLFLDEIGDMPAAMQVRLLRVLQERQVVPLGGGQPVSVDFALICATHRDLKNAVAQNQFRSDLYYRLNGLTVHLPPLRERVDFDALCAKILSSVSQTGRPVRIAEKVRQLMQRFAWPGNLRQLSGVLHTASAMLEPHEQEVDWHHLADDIQQDLLQVMQMPLAYRESVTTPTAVPEAELKAGVGEAADAQPLAQDLQSLSRQAITLALKRAQGNMSQAARTLGISRQTLYRKLKQQSIADF